MPSAITPSGHLGKFDSSNLELSSQILNIISRYKLQRNGLPTSKPIHRPSSFLEHIYGKVEAGQPILMCLPAFPFKSPNTSNKVLGRLPDKAEEFALAHLNGLCAAIGDVYPPGAKLMIISDGLVYNDLLSVPDKEVWAYGEALRALSARKKFPHIEFSRLKDLVHIDVPDDLDEITYVANATNFRLALLRHFSRPEFNPSLKISEDEDTCMTYRGYIKFLATDLQDVYPVGDGRSKSKYKKGVEYIAKQMLSRGDAFARAVREKFQDRLRLSIHPSTGENKLSISLLPTDTAFTTPWHCSIAFRLDGTTTTGPRSQFDADESLELVCDDEGGRPSYYREKTDLLAWGSAVVTCEPLYPAGLVIRPAAGAGALSIDDVDAAKVRALAQVNSPLVLRGFSGTRDRDRLARKAAELGTLEVKNRRADDTRGLNKVDTLTDSRKPNSWSGRFQLLAAVTAASPKNTGLTLFASSTHIFKHLPRHISLDYLRGLSLVVDHPSTGQLCLRFHEPWPQQHKPKFQATSRVIENSSSDLGLDLESTAVCDALTNMLHDRRIAYYHAWEKGDLLVNDNMLAMHVSSDFPAE